MDISILLGYGAVHISLVTFDALLLLKSLWFPAVTFFSRRLLKEEPKSETQLPGKRRMARVTMPFAARAVWAAWNIYTAAASDGRAIWHDNVKGLLIDY
jgi:hypothetical protein